MRMTHDMAMALLYTRSSIRVVNKICCLLNLSKFNSLTYTEVHGNNGVHTGKLVVCSLLKYSRCDSLPADSYPLKFNEQLNNDSHA